ncbi:hypothetical protein QUF74_18245, partial [Candidatus Halobeggiatoa sp. HSG11]|nr:hypothetical protein [Candidatus Halobeggiatoa sp. HSG11]
MDRITKQLLEDFSKAQEILDKKDDVIFEKFCNYTIITNEYNKTFDIETITIGGGNDTGIDGIAIIANGHLIENNDEIDDLIKANGYLDVTYIFIQAKTSSNFDTKEMHSFYFGVNDFFAEEHNLPRNSDIQKYSEISEHILNNASSFKENPKCKTFFITTGVFNKENEHIQALTKSSEETLTSCNLFELIKHNILGASEIGKLYRKTNSPVSSTFIFSNKITLPEIEGIEQAYYGVLPYSEFKCELRADSQMTPTKESSSESSKNMNHKSCIRTNSASRLNTR